MELWSVGHKDAPLNKEGVEWFFLSFPAKLIHLNSRCRKCIRDKKIINGGWVRKYEGSFDFFRLLTSKVTALHDSTSFDLSQSRPRDM